MCPGFQEPPNAGPVQLFLSLSKLFSVLRLRGACVSFCSLFPFVFFFFLSSSSSCSSLSPAPNLPPATVRSIFSLCLFLLGSSSSSWSSWSRERSIQSCDRKERTRHSSPRLLSIFFPFFSAALRIYLSIYYLFHPSLLSVADFCSFSWQPQIAGLLPAVVVKGI